MEKIFHEIDLRPCIAEMAEKGAALVRSFLREDFVHRLRAEIPAVYFVPAEPCLEKVQQRFDRFAYLYQVENGLELLEALRQALQNLIQSCEDRFPPLKTWVAVDTVVQRYTCNGCLSAHKDLARHPLLVASITLQGSAQFDILGQSRQSKPVISFYPGPGDLILLRANGLRGESIRQDARPFHRVSGARTHNVPRISVTFRDNLDPEKPIPGFSYRNG